ELERSGKLEMLKGSFLRLKNRPGTGKAGQVEYQGYNSNDGITFPLSFPLIINCGGFETLNSYISSELISGLIGKKLCETNCTGRGFKVNERFQAAEGLYVMGPLLGGIFNEKSKLWHVENAKSIFYLANLMVSEMTLGGLNKMIIRNN
ncbi:MAG: hypothetical protein JWM28_2549, partial [Chitinophagaceae bacterium]|nr:hypothetical protein [Chitinophagaceae bacterium]